MRTIGIKQAIGEIDTMLFHLLDRYQECPDLDTMILIKKIHDQLDRATGFSNAHELKPFNIGDEDANN